LRISGVEVSGPLTLKLRLTDGSHIVRNFRSLSKRGVFKKIADSAFFRRVRINKDFGTIEWPGGLDLCPDSLIDGGRRLRDEARDRRAKRNELRALARGYSGKKSEALDLLEAIVSARSEGVSGSDVDDILVNLGSKIERLKRRPVRASP
jgi:hypothetical protein